MTLPDVKNKILDGAMGVGGADSTGNFAAIGVSAIPSNGILAFVDPASVEEKIGDGPLRDLIVSALSIAKTTVYAIALEGTVPGTVSAVSAGSANAGSGAITVLGNPRNEYDVRVDITASGGLNTAAFRITIDGSAGEDHHRAGRGRQIRNPEHRPDAGVQSRRGGFPGRRQLQLFRNGTAGNQRRGAGGGG
ncbi:MAG: hypothetical protein LBH35_00720 [Treponema sp.]|jgi:hypothetical protein|nr:hypothetical protein [Treponema sp.]